MQQQNWQRQEQQHLQLSLASLGALAHYWPSRAPLAFAAAQPRCRIAAEARLIGALDHDDAESEYQAVWTDWARQMPFGDWWVSDLAEQVMPWEQPLGSEAHSMSFEGDITDDSIRHSNPASSKPTAAANATHTEREHRRVARPRPPCHSGASPLAAHAAALPRAHLFRVQATPQLDHRCGHHHRGCAA
ncbi:hypothetical protein LSCM1_01454 [Leishmania martiniquensis]|uniref:Uncharacterized protein n=1 Tax=Leishmania martiniquensis TaxID=1580590 RepID=A0A836H6M3_9TRYP|nr:hypothetical protein LSCM1_01454 [Leishmania martiniquensis]